VVYQVATRDGEVIEIDNPSKLPDLSQIEEIREPIIRATIIMPQEYVGPVITLCEQKRGTQVNMQYVGRQVILTYDMPLNEIVMDFFDKLKSSSRGYASLDYEFREFRAGDLVRLDILINGDKVDALSLIVHRETARTAAASSPRACASSSRARCSTWRCRRRSGPISSRVRTSRPCARTCSPSATAATSRASASCWRSRRPARSA
jgi:translation elongation factor EF-4